MASLLFSFFLLFCSSLSYGYGSSEQNWPQSSAAETLIASFCEFSQDFADIDTIKKYISDIKIIAQKTNNEERLKAILADEEPQRQKQKLLDYAMEHNHRNIVLYLYLKENGFIPAQFLQNKRIWIQEEIDLKFRKRKRSVSLTLPIDSLVADLRPYGVYLKKDLWGWEFSGKKDPREVFNRYCEF